MQKSAEKATKKWRQPNGGKEKYNSTTLRNIHLEKKCVNAKKDETDDYKHVGHKWALTMCFLSPVPLVTIFHEHEPTRSHQSPAVHLDLAAHFKN